MGGTGPFAAEEVVWLDDGDGRRGRLGDRVVFGWRSPGPVPAGLVAGLRAVWHPNLAAFLGVVEGSAPFLLFEWVDGPSLAVWLTTRAGPEALGPVLGPILDAVACLHQIGISHGRLTDETIRVGPDGPKLTGLGLAFLDRPIDVDHPSLGIEIEDDVRALAVLLDRALARFGLGPIAPVHDLDGLQAELARWAQSPGAPTVAPGAGPARLGDTRAESGDAPADPTAPTAELAADGFAARYALHAELGRGGMGVVLAAEDRRIHRSVAVKMVGPDAGPAAVARFVAEARIQGQLEHPGICPVYDLGLDTAGRVYFAMKRVSGRSFGSVLAAIARDPTGPTALEFPLARRVEIVVRVSEAVAFAHARGILHRDLKPDNIMIGEFGEVLVMDFGLAKRLDRTGPADGLPLVAPALDPIDQPELRFRTMGGVAIGTPGYMPPEQARGDTVDARSDVYALAATLYKALCLTTPVRGDTPMQVILRTVTADVLPPQRVEPAVPADLGAVVMKGLARRPEDRYPTVLEMQAELRRYLSGHTVGAATYSAAEVLGKWARRNRVLVGTAAVALAVILVLTTAYLVNLRAALAAAERNLRAEHFARGDALVAAERYHEAGQAYAAAAVGATAEEALAVEVALARTLDRSPPAILDLEPVVRTWRLPAAPWFGQLAVDPVRDVVFVPGPSGDQVQRVQLPAGTRLPSWSAGAGLGAVGLALSPDGGALYALLRPMGLGQAPPSRLAVFDAGTGAVRRQVELGSGAGRGLAVASSGEIVLVVGERLVRLRDPSAEPESIEAPCALSGDVAVSTPAGRIAVGCARSVVLLDARSLARVRTLEVGEPPSAIAFSSDGAELVLADRSGRIRRAALAGADATPGGAPSGGPTENLPGPRLRGPTELELGTGAAGTGLAFVGARLVVADAHGDLARFDLEAPSRRRVSFEPAAAAGRGAVAGANLAVAERLGLAITIAAGGGVRVHAVAGWGPELAVPKPGRIHRLGVPGWVAVDGADGLYRFDLEAGVALGPVTLAGRPIFDVAGTSVLAAGPTVGTIFGDAVTALPGGPSVYDGAISPHGRSAFLASTQPPGTISAGALHDLSGQTPARAFALGDGRWWRLARYSPDGAEVMFLAQAREPSWLWRLPAASPDPAQVGPRRAIRADPGTRITAADFAGSGVVVGQSDGVVRRFDPEPRVVARHGGPITAVAASIDGARIVSAGADGAAWLHDGRWDRGVLLADHLPRPFASVVVTGDVVVGSDGRRLHRFGLADHRARVAGEAAAGEAVRALARRPDDATARVALARWYLRFGCTAAAEALLAAPGIEAPLERLWIAIARGDRDLASRWLEVAAGRGELAAEKAEALRRWAR